ncbi:ABC transporter ATP-binding protein [Candidatus Contubernalis alkaliaceticus]|uniref:ABC transporter ATP-binding protein n=1 Tax=Candidatus Contubernalis alkaliaceticus TaxID=338645 RepID=UPI001F4C4F12|nr:ABC transporter ATP-binding protein [Candidatus Contubernalis alkalaceticus]UNC93276.1 ABC transporter ATP-binding protein [Candidatus Contubernalis alkalaceticus]
MLEIKKLSFSYGKSKVLHNINFNIEKGEIAVLVGPNGSGKSTLLRCIAGLFKASEGEVLLKGKKMQSCSKKWLSREVCFLPQIQMPVRHINVWELVAMGRSPYQSVGWSYSKADKEKIQWAIEFMNLNKLQHKPLDAISGGERQRAWIAMVLAQDTDLILLDEPITFLDIKYQWMLLDMVKDIRNRFGKTFIFVLHDINHALAVGDKTIVLKDGFIHASGCPRKILTSKLLYDVYGINAHICSFAKCSRPVIVPESAS